MRIDYEHICVAFWLLLGITPWIIGILWTRLEVVFPCMLLVEIINTYTVGIPWALLLGDS